MSSSKPYLIRALHEWIVDNNLTPHLLVNAEIPGVQVPTEYIDSGRITLNISPTATQGLQLGNDWIDFQARFNDKTVRVLTPVVAVLAIYARENGQGVIFENSTKDNSDHDGNPPPPRTKQKPKLVVVK
jgi:stringent starvation protein B